MGNQFFDNNPRLGGLICTLISGALCYWMIWMPIQQAERHEASVSISVKGGIVGVLGLAAGLVMLVFGHSATRYLRPQPGQSKIPVYFFGLIFAAIGFGAYFWLKSYLESKGYHFGG
jgi:hypothetical protein